MPAQITELIDKVDVAELVRDQIAAILKVESENQVVLARAAGKPRPEDWALRVFMERDNPWGSFTEIHDPDSGCGDETPVVNVFFDRETFDGMRGDTVQRQQADGLYNIDCYARGVSTERGDGGHDAGDEQAQRAAQRAMRWCRNILMSGQYTRLGMLGIVATRWPQSITTFRPQLDDRAAEQIAAVRLVLAVSFNEFSPQVIGQPLELISTEVRRSTVTGELLVSSLIDLT